MLKRIYLGYNTLKNRRKKQLITLKAIMRTFNNFYKIPFFELVEQEKLIKLNNLKGIEAEKLREREISRFCKIYSNIDVGSSYGMATIFDNFKLMSDSKLINCYLDYNMLIRIIREDKIKDEQVIIFDKIREEIILRGLEKKVGLDYTLRNEDYLVKDN